MTEKTSSVPPTPWVSGAALKSILTGVGRLLIAAAFMGVLAACNQSAPAPTPAATVPPSPTAEVESSPTPQPTASQPDSSTTGDPAIGVAGPLPDVPLEMGDRERGEKLFSSVGCIGCHTVKEIGGIVGPNLTEVANRAPDRARVQGLDSPELYFIQSVVYPKAFVVEGFNPVMPNWEQMQLTEQDLADLVAFLRTLDGQ
jgi:mono/diheme cytochrome c family protein